MKRLRILIILCLFLCGTMLLVACQNNPLQRPKGLRLDSACNNLLWDPVEDASTYEVEINGEVRVTRNTSYNISRLDPDSYKFRIRARSSNSQFSNSSWSESFTYVKEVESGLTYELTNNNTEYMLSGIGSWPLREKPDVVIDSMYRGKPVTSIKKSAFNSCTSMTSITLPDTITSIGDRAFVNCRGLTEIVLPPNLTSIGANAFQSCESLTSITIPQGVTILPEYAFAYCKALKTINFNDNITEIGNFAFLRCDVLDDVTIPSGVLALGDSAFAECRAMTKIDLANVETIGKEAFRACPELQTVTCKKLTKIGESAFSDCSKLNNVDASSVVRINTNAFKNCTALNSVDLGDALEFIGESAFDNTKFWENATDLVYVDNWVVGFNNYDADTVTFRAGTVGISERAFKPVRIPDPDDNSKTISKDLSLNIVVLPDSLVYINDEAFRNCDELSEVQIGPNVKKIGQRAFYSCNILSEVKFSEGLIEIASYAFAYCERLGEEGTIDLPNSLTEIGTYAFYGTATWNNTTANTPVYIDNWLVGVAKGEGQDGEAFQYSIDSIALRTGTVGIGDYACYQIGSLVSVTGADQDSLKYIGYGAFYQCSMLTEISISGSVKMIDDYAFYGCESLTNLVLGEGIEQINYAAFYGCGNVQSLTLPTSIKTIGEYAFSKCTSMDVTNFDSMLVNLESIGTRAFYRCENLTSVTIPEKVNVIEDYTFYKCTMLSYVNFNDSITKIGKRAFYGAAITHLKLPASLVLLDDYAFRDCENLEGVEFNNQLETIGAYGFFGCERLSGVVLPTSVKSLGAQAFRSCRSLTSIILHKNIESIGMHAFFDCNEGFTIYSEFESKPEGWNRRWNSEYRPTVWNCTLSPDKDYVVSINITENSIDNVYDYTMNPTERAGHTQYGWSTSSDGSGTVVPVNDIIQSQYVGKTLYAIWN